VKRVAHYVLLAGLAAGLICGLAAYRLRAAADSGLPPVELNAEKIGPRPIEELTAKSVRRDYAFAWQSIEQALEGNRPDVLEGYLTGTAGEDFRRRVASQAKSGLRTRLTDRGHHLQALFYSPAGDALELRDRAELDVEIVDGGKVIYDQPVKAEYMVLMTPGADRWLLREIQDMGAPKQ
jgi:hypothetical protein